MPMTAGVIGLEFAGIDVGGTPRDAEGMNELDQSTRTELEAAAFRRLVSHLQQRTDVQNIELMNLADFCRNCMSKWLVAAADERALAVDYDAARKHVYGMPYAEWKAKYQKPATAEQLAVMKAKKAH